MCRTVLWFRYLYSDTCEVVSLCHAPYAKRQTTMMIDVLRSNMKTPLRYAHAEIRSRVVVSCDPTRYELDQKAGPIYPA